MVHKVILLVDKSENQSLATAAEWYKLICKSKGRARTIAFPIWRGRTTFCIVFSNMILISAYYTVPPCLSVLHDDLAQLLTFEV